MSDEQTGSITPDQGSGTGEPPPPPPPPPSAGNQPVVIDLNPWVGQGGGVDSFRNEMPNQMWSVGDSPRGAGGIAPRHRDRKEERSPK